MTFTITKPSYAFDTITSFLFYFLYLNFQKSSGEILGDVSNTSNRFRSPHDWYVTPPLATYAELGIWTHLCMRFCELNTNPVSNRFVAHPRYDRYDFWPCFFFMFSVQLDNTGTKFDYNQVNMKFKPLQESVQRMLMLTIPRISFSVRLFVFVKCGEAI